MKLLRKTFVPSVLVLAFFPLWTLAQQPRSAAPPKQSSTATQSQKTNVVAAKTTKVWTDDDIASVRTPADVYADEQAQAKAEAAKAKKEAQPTASKAAHAAPSLLSDPKSVQDANGMIAWEQRDLDAQQEYVKELQDRIEKAPPEQQAKLRQVLQNRIEVVQRIQRDKKTLEDQKQQLEKKASDQQNSTSSGQPQQ